MLTLQCARAAGGTPIIAADRDEARLDLAKRFGATRCVDVTREDVAEAVSDAAGPHGADVVFETAGSIESTWLAPDLAAPGGVVTQVGWPGIGSPSQKDRPGYPVERVMEKEIDLRGVNRYANAVPRALSLIAAGSIDVSPLITHSFPLDRVRDAFELAGSRRRGVIKVLVHAVPEGRVE